MEIMTKELTTEEILTMLRQSDAGRGLCRVSAKEIERLAERVTELERELKDSQNASDSYENQADMYYGMYEAECDGG